MRFIRFRPSPAEAGVLGGKPVPTYPLCFTLPGQLPSGKNQIERPPGRKPYPNSRFKAWRTAASVHLIQQHLNHLMLARPLHLTVEYTPGDQITRDVSGMTDAILHLLEKNGVVENDKWIHDLTWRRQELDRKNPKAVCKLDYA